MTGKVHQIEISNCYWIRIRAGVFVNMAFVERVILFNIQQLVLDQYGLEFQEQSPATKLQLQFHNVSNIICRIYYDDDNFDI